MITSETKFAPAATPARPTPGKPVLSRSEEDTGMVANALLLGIDLGTSRSSIVSMNGARKTVESYVGWPKDAVSRNSTSCLAASIVMIGIPRMFPPQ